MKVTGARLTNASFSVPGLGGPPTIMQFTQSANSGDFGNAVTLSYDASGVTALTVNPGSILIDNAGTIAQGNLTIYPISGAANSFTGFNPASSRVATSTAEFVMDVPYGGITINAGGATLGFTIHLIDGKVAGGIDFDDNTQFANNSSTGLSYVIPGGSPAVTVSYLDMALGNTVSGLKFPGFALKQAVNGWFGPAGNIFFNPETGNGQNNVTVVDTGTNYQVRAALSNISVSSGTYIGGVQFTNSQGGGSVDYRVNVDNSPIIPVGTTPGNVTLSLTTTPGNVTTSLTYRVTQPEVYVTQLANAGSTSQSFAWIAEAPNGTLCAGSVTQQLLYSTDQGQTWYSANVLPVNTSGFNTNGGLYTTAPVLNNGRLVIQNISTGQHLYTTDGINWGRTTNTGFPGPYTNYFGPQEISTGNRLWNFNYFINQGNLPTPSYSDNYGNTWTVAAANITGWGNTYAVSDAFNFTTTTGVNRTVVVAQRSLAAAPRNIVIQYADNLGTGNSFTWNNASISGSNASISGRNFRSFSAAQGDVGGVTMNFNYSPILVRVGSNLVMFGQTSNAAGGIRLVSTDNGATWVGTESRGVISFPMTVSNTAILAQRWEPPTGSLGSTNAYRALGGSSNLAISTDLGATWSNVTNNTLSAVTGHGMIPLYQTSSGNILANIYTTSGLAVSTNNGTTFNALIQPLFNTVGLYKVGNVLYNFLAPSGSNDQNNTSVDSLSYTATKPILNPTYYQRSFDGGASYSSPTAVAFNVVAAGSFLAPTTQNPIGTYNFAASQTPSYPVAAYSNASANCMVVMANNFQLCRTTGSVTDTWTTVGSPLLGATTRLTGGMQIGSNLYAFIYNGSAANTSLWVSTDGGNTFNTTAVSLGTGNILVSGTMVGTRAVAYGSGSTRAAVWYSDDNGASWTQSTSAANVTSVATGGFSSMAVSSSNVLMAISSSTTVYIGVFRSFDQGVTWQEVPYGWLSSGSQPTLYAQNRTVTFQPTVHAIGSTFIVAAVSSTFGSTGGSLPIVSGSNTYAPSVYYSTDNGSSRSWKLANTTAAAQFYSGTGRGITWGDGNVILAGYAGAYGNVSTRS